MDGSQGLRVVIPTVVPIPASHAIQECVGEQLLRLKVRLQGQVPVVNVVAVLQVIILYLKASGPLALGSYFQWGPYFYVSLSAGLMVENMYHSKERGNIKVAGYSNRPLLVSWLFSR